jgi:hypothetical protein
VSDQHVVLRMRAPVVPDVVILGAIALVIAACIALVATLETPVVAIGGSSLTGFDLGAIGVVTIPLLIVAFGAIVRRQRVARLREEADRAEEVLFVLEQEAMGDAAERDAEVEEHEVVEAPAVKERRRGLS